MAKSDDRSFLEYLKDIVMRGAVGGTLGAPIDIADLFAQYATPDSMQTLQGDKALPKPRILGDDGNPVGGSEWLGQRMQDYGLVSEHRDPVGELLAGVATGFVPAARTGAAKLAPKIMPYLERANDFIGVPPTAATPSYVIKPKGGNWLKGSVEEALSGLKSRLVNRGSEFDQVWSNLPDELIERYRSVKDPEDVIKRNHPEEWRLAQQATNPSGFAINDWIDKQLTRYVKNEMATPEDPVRALAERGVLHFEPRELSPGMQDMLGTARQREGFPAEGMASTPLGRAWENAADLNISPGQAGDYVRNTKSTAKRSQIHAQQLADNPWVEKIPPDAKINFLLGSDELRRGAGFEHLIDELRNAINPDSGLPPELLLKYSSLPKVSVPQAVERVAKINEWRAAQQVEANQALAGNAATHLVKEYPESGMRWVELANPERRSVNELNDEHKRALADALKYEGDTMKHCVGGYCEDVAEGSSRIFSLRDAKGQPHVTIEVQPNRAMKEVDYDTIDDIVGLNSPFEKQMLEELGDSAKPIDSLRWLADNATGRAQAKASNLLADIEESQPRIVQIKGKQNRKPNPEYIPFVQDFVRTQGEWSEVGDYRNAEMARFLQPLNVRIGPQPFDVNPGYYSKQDLIDMAIKNGADPGVARIWAEGQGYADGGLVTQPNDPFVPDMLEDPQFQADIRANTAQVGQNLTSKDWWLDTVNAPREWLWENLIRPTFEAFDEQEYAKGGLVKYDCNCGPHN